MEKTKIASAGAQAISQDKPNVQDLTFNVNSQENVKSQEMIIKEQLIEEMNVS